MFKRFGRWCVWFGGRVWMTVRHPVKTVKGIFCEIEEGMRARALCK